jgi:hypothetical protein
MGVPKASGLHVIPQRAGIPGHPDDTDCAPLIEADPTIALFWSFPPPPEYAPESFSSSEIFGGTVQFGMATPVCPRRCVVTKRRPRMKEANLMRVRFMGPPKKNAKEENPATTPAAPAAATPRLFTVSLLLRGNLSRLTARRQ